MKKLVIFSMVASPHQVRFVPYLAKYFDVHHYFYEQLGGRQDFWKVNLGDRCHILPCKFTWHRKYVTLSVIKVLSKRKPDILLLGGFSIPANYLAYLWAKLHKVPVAVFTERSRNSEGKLRSYGIVWRLLRWMYRNVDLVITTAQDIVPQFRDTFRFGDKVVAGRYPTDIGRYFTHSVRVKKDAYTLIFPNRMTNIYNPIGAIDIFYEVLKRHPKTLLKLNASGELRTKVEQHINELGLQDSVEFLDNIKTWDELSDVYAACDIMYLPAKFSNGNYTISECCASGMGCVVSDRILGQAVADMKSAGTGFVVPLENPQFVEKICWYIEHPAAFARDAELNRHRLRYLTHEETAKLYNDLLSRI